MIPAMPGPFTAARAVDREPLPCSSGAKIARLVVGILATGDIEPSAVEEYVRVLGSKEALSAALDWYRANVNGRMLSAPALGKIEVPTLFVWSDADAALCREGAVATEQFVSGPYRFEILTGVDHWLVDKASDRLNPLLLDHIGKYREKH